jgi:hypothetical protein
MPSTTLLALAAAAAASAGGDRIPDRVDLTGGARLEGRVVYEDAAKLILRTGIGDKSIDMKDVKNVRSRARLQREAFDRWLALDASSLPAVLDLARSCRQTDLLEDAQAFAWYAVLLDPKSADAHALLEHRLRGSVWEMHDAKDHWTPFEKLLVSRKDGDVAEELSTSHYLVRTSLDLRRAVETALDLECFYRAFYGLFGADLELFEVVDPLAAHIYADERSFPEIATGRRAYTDPRLNTILIDASHGLDAGAIFHEATHQLLEATTRLSRSGLGDVPGWLHEGLAEYMRAGMGGPPGRRKFTPGALLPAHFATYAAAKAPYDLARVLHFGADDFLASSKSDLKYAQAYTLVQFCLHGENGRHRAPFIAFLRSAWHGQSSSSDFKKTLRLDEPAFEKSWLAYVRANAR